MLSAKRVYTKDLKAIWGKLDTSVISVDLTPRLKQTHVPIGLRTPCPATPEVKGCLLKAVLRTVREQC